MSLEYQTGRYHKERALTTTGLTLLHHCLILFSLLIFKHAGSENIIIKFNYQVCCMPERLPSISQQSEMAAMICQLAPHEGHTRTLLDGVRLMRADGALGRTPVLYEPGIVIVCQGHKRGYLA
ncbi:AraC family transcriptional regulator N-terminal domain-containing protein, partial [Klebsiella oxytoca]|uniref:AraC family transcriptional regulator N-terminal domain-containing protein n=1 Tax=Klebsiella oxytoca TaxID=571 RepID=UPI0032DA481D